MKIKAIPKNLKEIGYQIGAGFMVDSGQRKKGFSKWFIVKKLEPAMVGLGPFIPHKDTVFKDEKGGTVEMTTTMLALVGCFYQMYLSNYSPWSIDTTGREKG